MAFIFGEKCGGMRHAAIRSDSPRITSCRETSPHQSLRDSFSSRRSRLAAYRLHFRGGGTAKP